ncbi:RNA-binding family protein [Perilla frutescens var. hirtella]|uniref:RNA-binding family protein n=1 Tax=Perilla frutescens var. hirtella TaxID=608512 RepID=A0AAD4NZ09_PERFH|nr:RNA-binding family protein [Perilla frutescens var. hirtella]KAH6820943.1 RNA-binding family protein [Perilla frutescens var. hirtella]
MAATAAAAVASSFSTSMHSLKCISSKNWPNDHLLIKISCPKTLQPALVSHSLGIELNPTNGVCTKWRAPRIAAAVAQEEAALTAPAEDPPPVEEAEEADVLASDGVAAAENSGANTKLYFGNLPYLCDSAQLAGIIQEYASPELVEVLYDRNTGKSRGFAFVTMSSVEECNIIIQNLDGSEYGGRTLRVNFSDKPKPKDPLYPETEHKLFVGNLSWAVTSESLTRAFQPYGNVIGARVLYDGETGKSRGYGFVSYETRSELEAALEALNGVELEGRAMRVSLAQGKNQ